MTHNPPEKPGETRNGTGTVNPMVEPGLDLVAIEDLKCELLDSAVCLWDSVDVLAAIDGLVAEVKKLRYLIPIIEQNYALALEGLRKSQQTGKGFKCVCCGEWQPDGVGHRCEGSGSEVVGRD
jgi:hypothetical protein